MAVTVLADIVICDCCVIAAANADTSGHDFYCCGSPEPLSLIKKGWVVPGEVYADFSKRACDGCGETLAGTRHEASILA